MCCGCGYTGCRTAPIGPSRTGGWELGLGGREQEGAGQGEFAEWPPKAVLAGTYCMERLRERARRTLAGQEQPFFPTMLLVLLNLGSWCCTLSILLLSASNRCVFAGLRKSTAFCETSLNCLPHSKNFKDLQASWEGCLARKVSEHSKSSLAKGLIQLSRDCNHG